MKYHLFLLFISTVVFIGSGIYPKEYFTWILEVLPAFAGTLILLISYNNFKFSNLTYTCISIHICILCIGGHYTYAEVPAFDWIKDIFHQSRNNYDKVGHFAQGFVPALIARELFIQKTIITNKKWLSFIVVCVCMAISAAYELLEWFVSILSGESGNAFLGTQGYIWDTQSDILYATMGAIIALVIFASLQDKQIHKTTSNTQ